MKVGRYVPKPLKNAILQVVRIPEKTKWKVYSAASLGQIPFPDKAFQKWDYKVHCGRRLSFRNPQTFCEKLQWLKYYYRNPAYTDLVDKYAVRDYVKEKIGEEYLVPLYGVYDRWDDIDFDKLPDRFVLKCTHDSGSVVICKDKATFDFEKAKEKINFCLGRNQFYLSREWPYKNVEPRIIAEQYLEGDPEFGLIDYKLFMFNGQFKFILVCSNRFMDGGMKQSFYDIDWRKMDVAQTEEISENREIEKPKDFQRMIECAEKLSVDMPFVRVDFIVSRDKLYFSELTYFESGGRKPYIPQEFELQCGEWITLPPKMR